MNLNPKAKRILCFGDSNTWGASPETDDRYELNERWTGILQELIGLDYEVIEEGYGGRTTDLNDSDDINRNGSKYFPTCISSHLPLDYIVIALGSNDLKTNFKRTSKEIALGLENLVKVIKPRIDEYELSMPKVIILSPAIVNEAVAKTKYNHWEGTEEKSKQLAGFYKEVASKNGCEFINLAEFIESSRVDGVHLEKEAHQKIAEVLAAKILMVTNVNK